MITVFRHLYFSVQPYYVQREHVCCTYVLCLKSIILLFHMIALRQMCGTDRYNFISSLHAVHN